MNTYEMAVLLNEGPGRFWKYGEGDTLRRIEPRLAVKGESIPEALEALWFVGNKHGPDLYGRTYPRTQRSLSSGDVALVFDANGRYLGQWSCEALGWKQIGEEVPA